MLILQLLLKSKQRLRASSNYSDVASKLCVEAALRASQVIFQPEYGASLSPGAHDLLATIGELVCDIEIVSSTHFKQFETRLAELIASSRECSMHLMRGAVKTTSDLCCKQRASKPIKLNEDLALVCRRLFNETALNSVLNWNQIDNIHDLKWVRLSLFKF